MRHSRALKVKSPTSPLSLSQSELREKRGQVRPVRGLGRSLILGEVKDEACGLPTGLAAAEGDLQTASHRSHPGFSPHPTMYLNLPPYGDRCQEVYGRLFLSFMLRAAGSNSEG